MLVIKKGRNAVNVITDNFLEVPKDMEVTLTERLILGNGKEYEVISVDEGLMKVKPVE